MIIRAFNVERDFIATFLETLDDSSRTLFCNLCNSRWFGMRLDWIGCSIVFASSVLVVALQDSLNSALAGYAISYALMLTAVFQLAVRQSAETEMLMTSVERIDEYGILPPEGEQIIADHRPPIDWPSSGRVEFSHYAMRYREGLPLVLKGVTMNIAPGEKVGVCGRTGAGQ